MERSQLIATVERVMRALVDGRIQDLVDQAIVCRPTTEALANIAAEYGITLQYPPEGALDTRTRVYEMSHSLMPTWIADVPVWCLEFGESDVILKLELRARADGSLDFGLLDIRPD